MTRSGGVDIALLPPRDGAVLPMSCLDRIDKLTNDHLILRQDMDGDAIAQKTEVAEQGAASSLLSCSLFKDLNDIITNHPNAWTSLKVALIILALGTILVFSFSMPLLIVLVLAAVLCVATGCYFIYDAYQLSDNERMRLNALRLMQEKGLLSAKDYELCKKDLKNFTGLREKTEELLASLSRQGDLSSEETTYLLQLLSEESWKGLDQIYRYFTLKITLELVEGERVTALERAQLRDAKRALLRGEVGKLDVAMKLAQQLMERIRIERFLDELEPEAHDLERKWRHLFASPGDPQFAAHLKQMVECEPAAHPSCTRAAFFQRLLKEASTQADPFAFIVHHVEFYERCSAFQAPLEELVHNLRQDSDPEQIEAALQRFRDAYFDMLATEVREKRVTEVQFAEQAVRFDELLGAVSGQLQHMPRRDVALDRRVAGVSGIDRLPRIAAAGDAPEAPPAKPRILVLYSDGGQGHKSATEALKQTLGDEYEVESVNIFRDILGPLDGLRNLTGGRFTGEDLYNLSLQKGWHLLTNTISAVGNWMMASNRNKIEELFRNYLIQRGKSAPQMIISTIPVVNCGLAVAADGLRIPFLNLPTDLDLTTFVNGFQELDADRFDHYRLALPYEDPAIRMRVIQRSNLKSEQLVCTGFPVREGFRRQFTVEQVEEARAHFGMLPRDPTRRTVTVMMGGQGTAALLDKARTLATIGSRDCHGRLLEVNMIAGKSVGLGEKIVAELRKVAKGRAVIEPSVEHDDKGNPVYTKVTMPNDQIFYVRGFVKEVDQLLACTDVFVTKTGSCSFTEGIEAKKHNPSLMLLLDNTEESSARHLAWEGFNIPFAQQHSVGEGNSRIGDAYVDEDQLRSKLCAMVRGDADRGAPPRKLVIPDFSQRIRVVVAEMLDKRRNE